MGEYQGPSCLPLRIFTFSILSVSLSFRRLFHFFSKSF